MREGRVNTYAPRRSRNLVGHGKQKKSSPVTFECGQPEPQQTRFVDGKYKVVLPRNLLKIRGTFGSIS